MTKLWLVRHGHTDYNLEGRYNGVTDIPLSKYGMQQAEVLAGTLAKNGVRYAAVYSSSKLRARQTAAILNRGLDVPVSVDERLREIDLGVWEGMSYGDVDRKYPREVEGRRTNAAHVRAPGGESALEVAQRMVAATNDIVQAHPQGDVIVVAHGVALATLILTAQGLPLDAVYDSMPPHAQAVLVEWEGVKGVVV